MNKQYKKLTDDNLRYILYSYSLSQQIWFHWVLLFFFLIMLLNSKLHCNEIRKKMCITISTKTTRQATFMTYISFTRYARLHSPSIYPRKIQEYKKKITYSQLLFQILHTLIHRIHHQVPLECTLQLYNSPLPPRVYGMTGKKATLTTYIKILPNFVRWALCINIPLPL